MLLELPRDPRVPFSHPVKVVPLEGPPEAMRLFAGNLSREGMFLHSPSLPAKGTKLALMLEANGRALPFAEAEVVWSRDGAWHPSPGFGVRFLGYSNPRGEALVDDLVAHLTPDGRRVRYRKKAPEAAPRSRSWIWKLSAAAALAAALGAGVGRLQAAHQVRAASASQPAAPVPAPAPAVAVAVAADPPAVPPISIRLPPSASSGASFVQSGAGLDLTLELSPGASIERAFSMSDPPRLVIDVRGDPPSKSHVLEAAPGLGARSLRLGQLAEGTRLVVDLDAPLTRVSRSGNTVSVVFAGPKRAR